MNTGNRSKKDRQIERHTNRHTDRHAYKKYSRINAYTSYISRVVFAAIEVKKS